jgi:glycosyltransferase involved in cell wall biosynthesis
MEDKKALVFHSSSDLYGASNSLVRSLRALQERAISPTLVLSEPGPLSEVVEGMGIPVQFVRLGVLRRKYVSLPGILNRLYYTWKAVRQIRRLIRAEPFDIAITNTVVVFSGAIAARIVGLKHIWHVRETVAAPAFLKQFIIWMLNRTGDAVFFVSHASKRNYLPGLKSTKLSVIYNGIDPSRFMAASYSLKGELGIPEERILLLMVGRVSYLKGQHYFLEIARNLLAANHHLHFVLAGDVFPGNEAVLTGLRAFIQENNLTDHVTDLGFRQDVYHLMAGADIFVLPSILPDSLPTTVLEAMAAAKPVVATAMGGATEMVAPGESGYMIPWDDAAAAAQTLQKLIDDPLLRERMGKRGQQILMEKFSLAGYLTNFGRAVADLLKE